MDALRQQSETNVTKNVNVNDEDTNDQYVPSQNEKGKYSRVVISS